MNNSNLNLSSKPTTLRAIRCTQCGGSIEIHGGKKVRSIVCKYCGSCLDAKDEFKVLHQFLNLKRPYSPLKIGMKGFIKNVQFVVIGILKYEQTDEDGIYIWTEYLLFSKTHGYAWLIMENNHWVFMREIKDMPNFFLTTDTPLKTSFSFRDKEFQVFETGISKLTYVEGEMTWLAKVGDKSKFIDAISPPYILSVEDRENEREYFFGEYISHEEISKTFKVELQEPVGVYSCQPFCRPYLETIGKLGIPFAALNYALYFLFSKKGKVIFSQNFTYNQYATTVQSQEFWVNNPNKLLAIQMRCPLDNAWIYFDVGVQKDNQEFFNLGQEISYYHGVEDGESWSEGSREVIAYFRVPESGSYTLEISAPEGGTGEYDFKRIQPHPLEVIIKEDVRVCDFTFYLMVLFIIFSIPYYWKKYKFEKSRWGEDEEDDD